VATTPLFSLCYDLLRIPFIGSLHSANCCWASAFLDLPLLSYLPHQHPWRLTFMHKRPFSSKASECSLLCPLFYDKFFLRLFPAALSLAPDFLLLILRAHAPRFISPTSLFLFPSVSSFPLPTLFYVLTRENPPVRTRHQCVL